MHRARPTRVLVRRDPSAVVVTTVRMILSGRRSVERGTERSGTKSKETRKATAGEVRVQEVGALWE